MADALRLIAVSRNGLSQSEILGILEQLGYHGNSRVTSFDWALFRSAALDALFERPGGLLTFFHQHFKEAVEYTLLGRGKYGVYFPLCVFVKRIPCRRWLGLLDSGVPGIFREIVPLNAFSLFRQPLQGFDCQTCEMLVTNPGF